MATTNQQLARARPDVEQVLQAELGIELNRYRLQAETRLVSIATPPAGSDWTVTIPGGACWLVYSILGKLVCSATVANREGAITISDGTTIWGRVPAAGNVTASQTAFIQWWRGYGDHQLTSQVAANVAPFPAVPLLGGTVLAGSTVNIQATDAWSGLVACVTELRPRSSGEWANVRAELLAGAVVPGGRDAERLLTFEPA